MLIRSLAVFCCVSLSACAGQPKSARESDRTSEADRALSFVRAKQPALDDCYAREYLVGSPLGATYDFELVVPPAAIAHRVKIVGRSSYADTPGYCRSVKLAEIAEHGHVLTPGRYVGAEAVDDDDEGFETKMLALTEKLGEQLAKGAELDAVIRRKLGGLGYEF